MYFLDVLMLSPYACQCYCACAVRSWELMSWNNFSSMIVCTARYALYAFIQSISFILHTSQNVIDTSSLHVYNCTVLGIHFWSILMGDLSWLVWKTLACMKRSCIFFSLCSGRSISCSCMTSWLWYFMWDTYVCMFVYTVYMCKWVFTFVSM
jgi:hypothetical protein